MLAWRIARRPYALDRLGTGARLAGGRWNSEGMAAIYAALSPELAAMEKLVHTGRFLPADLVLVRIDLPDDGNLYLEFDSSALPPEWNAMPSSPAAAQLGDDFLRGEEKLGLIVPSAVMPESRNIIINPGHPAMTRVTMTIDRDFVFDPRLRP